MTTTMKMTIHEALAKKKLLAKQIEKLTDNLEITVVAKASKDVLENGTKKTEFKKNKKAEYQKIRDLITLRNNISKAIILSNATTNVVIAGQEMTVAEAIDLKSNIYMYSELLMAINDDKTVAMKNLEKMNKTVDKDITAMTNSLMTGDKEKSGELENIIKRYKEDNGYEIVEAIDSTKAMVELHEFIDDFTLNVDFVLSTSNALTTIEVQA